MIKRILFIISIAANFYAETASSGVSCEKTDKKISALVKIAEAYSVTAPNAALAIGSQNLIITDEEQKILPAVSIVDLKPGITISSPLESTSLRIPDSGQKFTLQSGSRIVVKSVKKNEKGNVCQVSVYIEKGSVDVETKHTDAKTANCGKFVRGQEVETQNIVITPKGTKYSVDLNAELAELNGEQLENQSETVQVQDGAIEIKLKKYKPSKKAKSTDVATADYEFDDKKTIELKRGAKAKIKKSKKDRVAEIEVIYPDN